MLKDKILICSSGSKESLQKMINKYFYSENWVINDDLKAENKVNSKILGEITNKKKQVEISPIKFRPMKDINEKVMAALILWNFILTLALLLIIDHITNQ